MNLGGDESHLYYAEPVAWANRVGRYSWYYAFSTYSPQYFFLPFTFLIASVMRLDLNPQAILLAINSVGGFFFSYLTIRKLAGTIGIGTAIAGGLIYSMSPIVILTQAPNLLYSIYWTLLLPALMYFLIRALSDRSPIWLVGALPFVVLFAPAVSAVPWSVGALIGFTAFVVLVVAPREGALRTLGYSVGYATMLIGISSFWLLPMAYGGAAGNSQVELATGASERSQSARVVASLGATTSPVDTLAGSLSGPLLDRFELPQRRIAGPIRRLSPAMLLLVAGAFAGLIRARRIKPRLQLLGAAVVALLLAALVADLLGVDELLTRRLPGWALFRNFYDKFAIPFAFFYAVFLALGWGELLRGATKQLRRAALTMMFVVVLLQGLPLVTGSVFRLPLLSRSSDSRMIQLPRDLYEVAAQIRAEGGSDGVMHVPLLSTEWTTFRGENGEGIYLGISPLKVLTDRSPFSGLANFSNPQYSMLPGLVQRIVRQHDAVGLRRLLAWLGIGHVLVARDADRRILEKVGWDGLDATQWERLLQDAGLAQISDSPARALYRLPTTLARPTLYAVTSATSVGGADAFHSDVDRLLARLDDVAVITKGPPVSDILRGGRRPDITFRRESPVRYRIRVSGAAIPYLLVFGQLFDGGWKLYHSRADFSCTGRVAFARLGATACQSGTTARITNLPAPQPERSHVVTNGYQNGWLVSQPRITDDFVLSYQPQAHLEEGLSITRMTGAGVVAWVLVLGVMRHLRRRRKIPTAMSDAEAAR